MRLITTEAGWNVKATAIETALSLLACGRICYAATCFSRSELALRMRVDDRTVRVGLCLLHAVEIAAVHPSLLDEKPRVLEPDDVLDTCAPVDAGHRRSRQRNSRGGRGGAAPTRRSSRTSRRREA